MAEINEEAQKPLSSSPLNSVDATPGITLTLPPRTSMESLFPGGGPGLGFGFSPGPMTLLSSFFPDNYDNCKSFSQLLAGAMSSPASVPTLEDKVPGDRDRSEKNIPAAEFVISQPSPVFTAPSGLSGLLDSPGYFSPGQVPSGITHQQARAQVRAQATQQPGANLHNPSSSSDQIRSMSQVSSYIVDKPAKDGYKWRKYGQKQVKGSEFPRSYYKCTHQNCPVKKKVERSLDGQVTEIIYKGQHNHQPPQQNKRAKDSISTGANLDRNSSIIKEDWDCSSRATSEQISCGSDNEEVGHTKSEVEEKDEDDEPDAKRRSTDQVKANSETISHRTITEPRIIVQTTSEIDLLDDGYRWRKYGQKVVKGNPYPRSYYKCTTQGCNVRKHVERASTDRKAVITTYEGKHNHNVPAAKCNGNTNMSQIKLDNAVTNKHEFDMKRIFGTKINKG